LSLHVLLCYFPCMTSFANIFARSLLPLPQHIPLCQYPCMHVFIVILFITSVRSPLYYSPSQCSNGVTSPVVPLNKMKWHLKTFRVTDGVLEQNGFHCHSVRMLRTFRR
jgi:hypothetical protein